MWCPQGRPSHLEHHLDTGAIGMWNVMMLVGVPCNRISKVMGCKVLQRRYHSASRTHRTVGPSFLFNSTHSYEAIYEVQCAMLQNGHTRTKYEAVISMSCGNGRPCGHYTILVRVCRFISIDRIKCIRRRVHAYTQECSAYLTGL